jgi:hypothetical protein
VRDPDWNRRKRSITSPILKNDIRENVVSEYFLAAGGEVGPFHRLLLLLFGNNVGDDAVPLPEFDRVAGPKLGF